MGTTYKGLYLPATSEVGWQTLVNDNFTTIADDLDQFLPATTGRDNTGAVCALFGTFPNTFPYFLLANSVTAGATWVLRMPGDMTNGITCKPVWLPSTTDSAAHAVQWQFNVRQVFQGGDIGSTAAGTSDTVAWTGASSAHNGNQAYYETGTTSTALTLVAGNLMRVSISRLGADALDTYLADVRLLGMTIGYA